MVIRTSLFEEMAFELKLMERYKDLCFQMSVESKIQISRPYLANKNMRARAQESAFSFRTIPIYTETGGLLPSREDHTW